MILGDNGDIFRPRRAPDGTSFLTFNYDNYASTERIIPRAYRFLDYTQGNPVRAGTIGAADLIHGENGDDTIHGMTGNDVLFGEGQDDNIYGGTGNDRIYGGTGEDGILGDDGVILTSRNGQTEPLNGLVRREQPRRRSSEPGPFTAAELYIAGELFKTAQLARADARAATTSSTAASATTSSTAAPATTAISGAEAGMPFYNETAPVPADANPLQYDDRRPTRKFADVRRERPVGDSIPNWFLNFDPYVLDEATGLPIDIERPARSSRTTAATSVRRRRQRLARRRHRTATGCSAASATTCCSSTTTWTPTAARTTTRRTPIRASATATSPSAAPAATC